MRRLAILALLLLATAAQAQPQKITVIAPPAKAAEPAKAPPPVLRRLAQPGPSAMQQVNACTTACSRRLYFCQAESSGDCGAPWAKCRAACSASAPSNPLPR